MKTNKIFLLLAMLMSMAAGTTQAFEVKNADGVTINYDYIYGHEELELQVSSPLFEEYRDTVNIPAEVTYENRTLKVTAIGNWAFKECRDLTCVTIPNSVTSIGYRAFYRSGLTSVTIPNSVTSIGDEAFYGCYFTSVAIPNGLTKIGEGTFEYCDLTSVTIPGNVTSIGEFAFFKCKNLTSVTILNGVTSIGKQAFSYCRHLTSVTIPNSVTSIGEWAFSDCDSLAEVVSLIEKPFKIYTAFEDDANRNATLYVPVGTIDEYKATWGWMFFDKIVEGKPTNISQINTVDAIPAAHYTLDGQCISEPKKGINIIKMRDGTTKKVLIK